MLPYLHWMQLCIWRFSLSQLDSSDTQTPDVSLVIITALLDNFRRHPVWRPNERVLLRRQRARKLPRYTEIRQLDIAVSREQDIRGYQRS